MTKPQRLTDDALNFEKPTTLDEALATIARLSASIEIGIEQIETLQEEVSNNEDEIGRLEGDVADLNYQLETVLSEAVADLEEVRQYMAAGKIGEAMYRLERVLQEQDGACTRANVVATMLPGMS